MDDAGPQIDANDALERARAFAVGAPVETLALEAMAVVAGLSTYHFVRQFAARFGVTPMAFVREQRLVQAARRLTGEAPPTLVDLAFDCGFESQEGFTRAFKRAFGVSPGRYRRGAAPPKETLMSETSTAVQLSAATAPQHKPGIRVAGFAAVFDETNRGQIPALWTRLVQRLPLAGQTGDESFGVCWGQETPGGAFNYMAAVPIAADAPAPDGMTVKEVPAQTYLVFRQETDGSNLHRQMQAGVKEIWGERVPKSGFKLANGPDLEAYPPGFEPDQPSHVEWWIPVEA